VHGKAMKKYRYLEIMQKLLHRARYVEKYSQFCPGFKGAIINKIIQK
jgi:hypothetical protein